jgi:siroheme synthase
MDLNWPELVQPNQTLVFYMGLNGMETICQQLMAYGLDSKTPAALIEKGHLSQTEGICRGFAKPAQYSPVCRSQSTHINYCWPCGQPAR